jgi:hypothetical protein
MTPNDQVLSVHKDKLIEESTSIYNWFVKQPHEIETDYLLKITTEKGHIIKCTVDHKLLTLNRSTYDFPNGHDCCEVKTLKLTQDKYDEYTTTKECKICQEKYTTEPISILNPCNHIFHHECILRAIQDQYKCPTCRTNIVSITRLIVKLSPDDPSLGNVFFGGFSNKLQKYIDKLKYIK